MMNSDGDVVSAYRHCSELCQSSVFESASNYDPQAIRLLLGIKDDDD